MNRDSSNHAAPVSTMETANDPLANDSRWQLVNRIAGSPGLARARQLREFLLFSARWALENPGKPLSEHDIAYNVMGRRKDFDPAQDNIVRVQATHLRRKLETYFASEGTAEQTVVVLPKGIYTPQFVLAEPKPSAAAAPATIPPAEAAPPSPHVVPSRFANPWLWVVVLACVCVLLVIALTVAYQRPRPQIAPAAKSQAILSPLLRNGKPVTIILPDLGLSAVQNLMGREIDVQQYADGGFPEGILGDVRDPRLHEALSYIGSRRAISYSELNAVLELVRALQSHGITATVRFARDIHVRDLGTDNVILIGSRRSNLWMSLFVDRTNFRFVEDPQTREFYFENKNPLGQEDKRYLPTYTSHGGDGYIDVAVLPNTTNSGYMLFLDGSDAEVSESAVRYLLDGNLPASLQDGLNRPTLQLFEVFLRGRHLVNESDSEIQVIASRQAF